MKIARLLISFIALIAFFTSANANAGIYPLKHVSAYIDAAVKGLPDNCLPQTKGTIQLFTHGRPGQLLIEGQWKNPSDIAQWVEHNFSLHNYTHLNIYGCEFAKGQAGLDAVHYLEQRLQLSISASTNITGKGGDWNLETGKAEDVIELPEYQYNLQCTYGTVTSSQYATVSSGGYSGGTSGSGSPDNTGISVYTTGSSYQGIFTYASSFTGGSDIIISGKYNDSRVDGIFLQFSTDNITYTAASVLVNGFGVASGTSYTNVTYTIPTALTGAYKYIKITGNSANTYLNIDAIKATNYNCAIFNGNVYNDAGTGGGTYGNSIKDGTESGTNNPTGLYANVLSGSTLVYSAPVDASGNYYIAAVANGTYTLIITNSNTATMAALPALWSFSSASSYSFTVTGGTVPTPGAMPAIAIKTCPYGSISNSQYASVSSGGYSGSTAGSGAPDGTGISVYNTGSGYQGIFTYTNTFTGGQDIVIAAKYNDTRVDGIFVQFSADNTTYTAVSVLINGFGAASGTSYTNVTYTIPTALTGSYKYIKVTGNSANTYLNIDAIKVVNNFCNTCPSGLNAPALSSSVITAGCHATTVDLTTITASNGLANTTVTWHTGTPASNANKIANPAAATATENTVYYAAFFNAANSCYSGISGDGTATTSIMIDLDTDCDGIRNGLDIDDDNDGVLDVSESLVINSCYNCQFDPGYQAVSWINAPYIGGSFYATPIQGTATVKGIPVNVTITASTLHGYDGPFQSDDFCPQITGSNTSISSDAVGVHTIAFDKPIRNPRLLVSSMNTGMTFSQNVVIIQDGTPRIGNSIAGCECDATVIFPGVYNQISWTGGGSEFRMSISVVIETVMPTGTAPYVETPVLGSCQVTTFEIDTDNDGIPNRLDLDSDGDGCSDAKEAGATSSTATNYQFTGADANNNGLVDSKENGTTGTINYTSNYSRYALSAFLNACADTDGDGIGDLADIDDDNDGVLDATEAPGCYYTQTEAATITAVSSGLASYSTNVPANAVDNNAATYNAFNGALAWVGVELYRLTPTMPIAITNMQLDLISWALSSSASNTFKMQGSNDGSSWTDLSAAVASAATTGTFTITNTQSTPLVYSYYRLVGVAGTSYYGGVTEIRLTPYNYIASANPKNSCTIDTDGDGIINTKDLDSDGDGCSDAKEAGATTSTTTNYQFTGAVGTNGLIDSKETATDNGVINYGSTYYLASSSTLNACADTDGDGIPDLTDIDDDNDGIPDLAEHAVCTDGALSSNSGGAVSALAWDDGGGTSIRNVANSTQYITNTLSNSTTDAVTGSGMTVAITSGFWHITNVDATTFSQAVANNEYIQFPIKTQSVSSNFLEMKGWITNQGSAINANVPENFTIQIADNASFTNPFTLSTITGYTSTASTLVASDFQNKYALIGKGNTYYLRIYYYNVSGGNADQDGFGLYFNCYTPLDTDGDGVTNDKDLDSDNDGCSDAKEAGATTSTTANYQFTGAVGINGLIDSKETAADNGVINYTSTYSRYALSTFLNACADTDGDGIGDLVDIDDDNDGVLDATEAPGCYYTQTEAATITAVSSGLASYSTNVPANAIDNNAATYNAFNGALAWVGVELYRITPTIPIAITNMQLDLISWALSSSASNTFKMQGSNDGSSWTDLSAAVASTATTGTFTITNTQSTPLVYSYYRLIGVAGTSYYGGVTEIRLTPSNYIASANPKNSCSVDTDNDGIINTKDLDSDGDGCSDAKEAGATTSATANYQFTGTDANGNGLVDSKENGTTATVNYTSTYANYANAASLNVCQDSDNDGIGDLVDIDDDNDGILDVTEMSSATSVVSKAGVVVSIPSTITYTYNGSYTPPNLVDGVDNNTYVLYSPAGTLNNSPWLNITFPTAKILNCLEIGHYNGQQLFSSSSTYKIQATNDTLGTWTDVTGTLTYNNIATSTSGGLSTYNSNIANIPASYSSIAYKYYRIYGISGTSGGGWATELYFKELVYSDIDTDGDGIPNRLDLDSDDDGCSDAKEAGATTSTTANYQFTGAVGTNGLIDSKETATDNGIINYTSTYSPYAVSNFLSGCADTDGDGIPDLVDIDDDNDGVPDATEAPGCYYTQAEAAAITAVSSGLASYSTNLPANAIDNNAATYNAFNGALAWVGVELYRITPTIPVAITNMQLDLTTWALSSSASNTFKMQGSTDGSSWTDLSAAVASTATTGTFTITNTQSTPLVYGYYRLVGVAGTSYYGGVTEIRLTPNNYIASAHPKSSCSVDTDGDGIINTKDLDSDGDGCSDAKEAGATTSTTANYQFTGAVGADGLVDSKETAIDNGIINYTSTYSNYAVYISLSLCSDTDNDGVPDPIDIDDDNDGILDITEMNACGSAVLGSLSVEFYDGALSGSTVDNIPLTGALGTGTATSFNVDVIQNLYDPGDGDDYSIRFSGYINIATAGVYTFYTNSDDGSKLIIDGTTVVSNDGVHAPTEVSGAITLTAGYHTIKVLFFEAGNGQTLTVSYSSTSISKTALPFGILAPSCTPEDIDTDNDGIPNRLDLDSDGDGCSDAAETGITGTLLPATMINNSGSVYSTSAIAAGPYGANGFANPLETSTESGVYTGSYTNYTSATNNAIHTCAAMPVLKPDVNATYKNMPLTGNLGTNDSLPSGSSYSSATALAGYSNPTATMPSINSNGSYTFTSSATGIYKFMVTVCPSSVSAGCPTELLTIAVMDAAAQTNKPFVAPDFGSVKMNGSIALKTLANDRAGNTVGNLAPASVSVTVAPLHGTTSVNSSTGNITYTPVTGYTGTDTLAYSVCDDASPTSNCNTGYQIVTVLPSSASNSIMAADDYAFVLNTATVNGNLITNDNDPDGNSMQADAQTTTVPGVGTMTLASNGSYSFAPVSSFTGPVNFVYRVCDNGSPAACANATAYFLVSSASALPVKLVSFTGAAQNNGNLLKWVFSQEVNTHHFELKYSTDAVHFKTIATVAAAVNSNTTTAYQYLHTNPANGNNFYQLVSVDQDGLKQNSPVINVRSSAAGSFSVYPNPTTGWITAEGEKEDLSSAGLFNTIGQNISGSVQRIRVADNSLRLNLASLPQGVYYLKTKSNAVKIIKE